MKNLLVICMIILGCSILNPSKGQEVADTLKLYQVETSDGNIFIGTIFSQKDDSLSLKTDKFGIMHFGKFDVRSIKELKQVSKTRGEYWLPNTQSSRYFWAPNGYGLKKGEAYFQNIWVLYNQLSFGLTDNFSLGVGMIPAFFFGAGVVPLWLVPKFSIPLQKEKINLGIGSFLGTVIGEDTGIFGLLYGTTTFGSRDKNLSLGLAYGFADGGWMDKPLINISTMIRTGPKGYFISENYILPIDNQLVGILSFGGRSMIRKLGLDYSLWIPIGAEMDSFFAFPFLGITIPLNKN